MLQPKLLTTVGIIGIILLYYKQIDDKPKASVWWYVCQVL